MGLFWEIYQQMQNRGQKQVSSDLTQRVADLEDELIFTQDVLYNTLEKLEQLTGEDFTGEDGESQTDQPKP